MSAATAARDLSYPTNRALRGAQSAGFAARLEGASRYASPYGDAIERAEAEGRRPGWLWPIWRAWNRGWLNADSLLEDATA